MIGALKCRGNVHFDGLSATRTRAAAGPERASEPSFRNIVARTFTSNADAGSFADHGHGWASQLHHHHDVRQSIPGPSARPRQGFRLLEAAAPQNTLQAAKDLGRIGPFWVTVRIEGGGGVECLQIAMSLYAALGLHRRSGGPHRECLRQELLGSMSERTLHSIL